MELSLVIPTYNERENIVKLVKKINNEFKINNIKGEIIIVDDNSPDGTGQIIENLKKSNKNLKVVHREGKLGLSSAVLEGWKIARGKVLGVMDADFSHPPEKLKEMFFAISKDKADFVIGSRHVAGGQIKGWNFKRKIMSKTATLLARPYTSVKDPMAGFFMIKRDVIRNVELNPKGFKILLEIIIKGKYKSITEIPIVFVDRKLGKSKAGTKEIIYYIQNLSGYWKYRRKFIDELFKFALVGALGTLINLFVLYFLTERVGIHYLTSAIISFFIAMTSNFILNKTWTFEESLKRNISSKYLKFGSVSLMSLGVNLLFLYFFTEFVRIHYLVSQLLAIAIATIFNFLGNKKWTFRN